MKPQEPQIFSLFDEENGKDKEEISITGVKLLHRFAPYARATVWLIDYDNLQETDFSISPGKYCLLTVPETVSGAVSCATRLCTLEEHPALATVEALSQFGSRNHIWAQPVACTLADLLKQTPKLTPSHASWLAEQLGEGLEFLHRHSMGFDGLTTEAVAFTADLRTVLLPPNIDTRGLKEQKVKEQVANDVQSFARLLWMCLTGEIAPEQNQRLPLNVVLPTISATTAKLFEQALDQVENYPSPLELALALKQDAVPEVPQIHLAAPAATRGSIKPLEKVPTRETREKISSKRKSVLPVAGDLRTRSKLQKSQQSKQKTESPRKRKLNLAIVAAAAVVIAGGTLWAVLPKEQATEAVQDTEEVSTSPSPETQTAEANEDDAVVEMVQNSLDLRNQALASGKADTIVGYAAVGSSVEKSDREVVQQNAGNPMKAQLVLDEIHEYSLEEDIYTVTATVKADKPLSTLTEVDSVYIQDGVPHQKVEMVFQRVEDGWLLMQATPLALS